MKLISKKIFENFGIGFISEGLNLTTAIFISFYLTKNLGIDTYGEIVLVNVIIGSITTFLSFSPSESLVKFFKEYEYNLDIKRFIFILNKIFVLLCISIILLIVLSKGNIVSNFFSREDLTLSLVYSTYFFSSNLILRSFIGFFQSFNKFISVYIYQIFLSILKLLTLIYFIEYNLISESFEVFRIYFYSSLIICSLAFIEFLYVFFNKLGFGKIIFDKKIAKDYFKFSFKSFSIASIKSINSKSSELLIGYFGNNITLGVFNLIKKFTFSITQLNTVLVTRYYPHFLELKFKNKFRNINTIIFSSIRYITVCYIIFTILSYIAWDPLSNFIGIENVSFMTVFLGIVVAYFTTLLWWSKAYSYTLNINYSIQANFLKFILIIIFTPVLVYYFDLLGGIISELVIVILISIYWTLILKKSTK